MAVSLCESIMTIDWRKTMKTSVKYVLMVLLVIGGLAGLAWATQMYAGFPLQLPAPTEPVDCPECGGDDVSGELKPPPSEPLVSRERLVEGTVIDVKEDTVIVSSTKRGLVTLLILPETRIWKGKWDNTLPIEVGDYFYGYGEPNADDTVFTMEQLEINIVNLRGGITRVTDTVKGMDLEMIESRSEQLEIVHINAETMISTDEGQYPFGKTAVEFEVDDGVQIIGVRLKDGTVLATTVF